nr:hypothetical protein Itr_chr07CG19020 [Ipomoea trifida]
MPDANSIDHQTRAKIELRKCKAMEEGGHDFRGNKSMKLSSYDTTLRMAVCDIDLSARNLRHASNVANNEQRHQLSKTTKGIKPMRP